MIEDKAVFISIMAYLWPEQKMTQNKKLLNIGWKFWRFADRASQYIYLSI